MSKYLTVLKGRCFSDPTPEELSKLPKGAFGSFGSTQVATSQKHQGGAEGLATVFRDTELPADDLEFASWRWSVTLPGRQPMEVHFSPEASRAEVQVQYPDAIAIEPLPVRPPVASRSSATESELQRVRAWLGSISETDPRTIAETLEGCRRDPEALAYFLGRARTELPKLPKAPDLALAKLEADPNLTRAMVADDSGDPVRIGLAVRGVGAFELLVPRVRYDGMDLLELWQRHTEGSA